MCSSAAATSRFSERSCTGLSETARAWSSWSSTRSTRRSTEFDGGPTEEALYIIYEAYNRKYLPAMIRLAQIEMCEDIKYWPEGAVLLMEAYKLGSQEAIIQLKNDWHNSVKDIDAQRKVGDRLNKYEEFVLAFYYYYGIEVEKDESLALHLFQSSVKQGCEEAEIFLREVSIA